MRVTVTGGSGYVGSVLVDKLLKMDMDVVVYDTLWFGRNLPDHPRLTVKQADIRDTDNICLDGSDAVIHLANIANDPCGDLNPKLSWEVNVLAGMQLVEKAVKAGVGQFLFASSGSVYGVKEESEVTEDLSLVPISDYNKTKMVCERVLLSYADKINLKMIRPATVCGLSPRTRFDVSVNMFAIQALTKGEITIFGGQQTRPNIHIQDLTDVFIHMLSLKDKCCGTYNAGFENLSLIQVAEMVTSVIPAKITFTESNDPRSYRLDSKKLLSTGFVPKKTVIDAVLELKHAYEEGKLSVTNNNYNIKRMQELF